MNKGGENDHGLLWENNEEWLFLNLNDQTLEGDKLPDPNRSDTCQEVVEASTDVGKKRNPSNRKKVGNEPKSGADGGGESEHDIHIWTERERRKKMRNMFETLHALLPQLPAKVKKKKVLLFDILSIK